MQLLVTVCNLEALDDHKISPLFVAAQYGQSECLQTLIDAGRTFLLSVEAPCVWLQGGLCAAEDGN